MAKKWRLPPLSWYRAAKNKDRPLDECVREYYARYPEHRPPPEFYSNALWSGPELYSNVCAGEAQRGNPGPLIGYLQSGRSLSPAAIKVIVEALEAKRGKRYRDKLREVEQFLIAAQVERLVREKDIKQEAAIETVVQERNRSRRHVYSAMKAHKQGRGHQ